MVVVSSWSKWLITRSNNFLRLISRVVESLGGVELNTFNLLYLMSSSRQAEHGQSDFVVLYFLFFSVPLKGNFEPNSIVGHWRCESIETWNVSNKVFREIIESKVLRFARSLVTDMSLVHIRNEQVTRFYSRIESSRKQSNYEIASSLSETRSSRKCTCGCQCNACNMCTLHDDTCRSNASLEIKILKQTG